MKLKKRKFYHVRTHRRGDIIHARGWRDALTIRHFKGGKIL